MSRKKKSTLKLNWEKPEALEIIGMTLLEEQTRGKPEHDEVVKALEDTIALWRKRMEKRCPHCGEPLN